MRQVYPMLPSGTSYPAISDENGDKEQQPLLVYSLSASLQPYKIKEIAEPIIRQSIAEETNIKGIKITGTGTPRLSIIFDMDNCWAWHVNPDDVADIINSFYPTSYPGQLKSENGKLLFLKLPSQQMSIPDLENLNIPTTNGELIPLKKIAIIRMEETDPDEIIRVNGKNSLTLTLFAKEGKNNPDVAYSVRKAIDKAGIKLPGNIEICLLYDSTYFIKHELARCAKRIFISLAILILLLIIFYRRISYALIVLSSILVTAGITVLLIRIFEIPIHLSTVAGLAIAFSLATDNNIIIFNYYRYHKNLRVYPAMLGSALILITIIFAILILSGASRGKLIDFSAVIIATLVASLISAAFYVPAIIRVISSHSSQLTASPKIYRRYITRLLTLYGRIILMASKYKRTTILLTILAFGIPFFMLPPHLEGNKFYHSWYNNTYGNNYFQENIRPFLEKYLGGTFRLFVEEISRKTGFRDIEETRLFATARLPSGNNLQQMDTIIRGVENSLMEMPGIQQFITHVYSGEVAGIEIRFKQNLKNPAFPHQLKAFLINRSISWGGVDWDIYGIGQGFSNSEGDQNPKFEVIMKGYDYDELEKQVLSFSNELSLNRRVQNVNVNGSVDRNEKERIEYLLSLDEGITAINKTNKAAVLKAISWITVPSAPQARAIMDDSYYPILIQEKNAGIYSDYDLRYGTLRLNASQAIRMNNIGSIIQRPMASNIHKENRVYIRVISLVYLGESELGMLYLNEQISQTKDRLPPGYSVEIRDSRTHLNGNARNTYYSMLSLLLAVVFFTSGVIFNSLRKAFFIVAVMPVSFIGLFLAFSLGGFYFDQGGYAAFIVVGATVSSTAILIIYNLAIQTKLYPSECYNQILLKVVLERFPSIILTSASTCIGFLPFLLEDTVEIFWYPLAIGSISGILFALAAVIFLLPVWLCQPKQ